MRKNFFPLRVMEPWPRLPRGAVESPSLEIFKPCLDAVLCSLLWVTLLWQGVGLGDPKGPFQPRTFCDSVTGPGFLNLAFRESTGLSIPLHKRDELVLLLLSFGLWMVWLRILASSSLCSLSPGSCPSRWEQSHDHADSHPLC